MPDHEGKDGGFDGKTYLYIRTNPADTGVEPLPAGLDFWISPDIVVVPPGGAPGEEAVAGEENQVGVTVTNAGGIEAVDAYLEAFVADPSTVMTPATATRVGAGFLSVPAYGTASMSFPWTPLPTDAGHRCLLARVVLTVPFDSYVDPAVFDVVGDRHVAQRNIHVVSVGAKRTSFAFIVANPSEEPELVQIQAEEVRSPEALRLIGAAMGCGAAGFGKQGLEAIGLSLGRERVLHGEERHEALQQSLVPRRSVAGLVRASAPERIADNIELELEPGEARQAVLHVVPAGRPAGSLSAVRVTQVDAEGNVRGGLTVVLR